MFTALLASEGTLSIDWLTILLHILNLAVLVFFIWILLYKPVKKMIKKRHDYYKQLEDEGKSGVEEVGRKKAEYDGLIDQAKQEVAKASETAKVQVEEQKKQIIEEAHKEADLIKFTAKDETEKEKKRMETALKEDVAELATGIAEKIIQREIKKSDNKKIIDDCLSDWSKNE